MEFARVIRIKNKGKTAFILCPESSASEQYQIQIKSELAQHTAITAAISGRPARGLMNKMYFNDKDLPPIPDYPRFSIRPL